MKSISIPITLVTFDLGTIHLVEALEFPELSFAENPLRAERALIERIESFCVRSGFSDLWQREAAEPVEVLQETISIPPPKRAPLWTQEYPLTLDVLRWNRADGLLCGVVPLLYTAAVANNPEQLQKRLLHEIRSALTRNRFANQLSTLVRLNESQGARLKRATITLRLPTLKEKIQDEGEFGGKGEHEKAILPQVARLLNGVHLDQAFEIAEPVLRLLEKLQAQRPRSVLLVGKSGVGKTAAFYELVRLRASLGLGSTQFWETSGARLVAGMTGFGMWQQRCVQMVQEAAKSKSVLHLGNLAELSGVGQSVNNETSIASFLRTYLERGDFAAICECTAEQLTLLEREQPHVAGAFDKIEIREPEWPVVRTILDEVAKLEAKRRRVVLKPEALDETIRLHRRYGGYSANPGRPLRFLKNLMRDLSRDPRARVSVSEVDVLDAFTRETGLPRLMLDDGITMDPAEIRIWFRERIIGQEDAIARIVEMLARIKARLTRPARPIASLLFVGPTGTGKTETAKMLAEFLFGDKGRMTRFDMSEYADPISVRRLIGGLEGSEGLLTAKIREQPFSVLLLDECEKADPSAFDLLLQVLGEARLTDAAGRVADFSNSVVILTSNLGAQGFLRGDVGFIGQRPGASSQEHHFTEEARRFFRPELFNRIDEIVPFHTLDEASIVKIAKREFDLIRRRDGFASGRISLEIEPPVFTELARRLKNNPYGARPLKREIEREILSPLAAALQYPPAARCVARASCEESVVRVRLEGLPGDLRAEHSAAEEHWSHFHRLVQLRRNAQGLRRSQEMQDLENEITQLRIAETTAKNRGWRSPELVERLKEFPRLKQISTSAKELHDQLCELEREHAPDLGAGKLQFSHGEPLLAQNETRLQTLADSLAVWRLGNPNRICLGLFGPSRIWWQQFGELYAEALGDLDIRFYLMQYAPDPNHEDKLRWEFLVLPELSAFTKTGEEKCKRGLLLEIRGPMVALTLLGEKGWHELRPGPDLKMQAYIDPAPCSAAEYRPPHGAETNEVLEPENKARRFEKEKRFVDDAVVGKLAWGDEPAPAMLNKMLAERLRTTRNRIFGIN